jgi:hypothetical protein
MLSHDEAGEDPFIIDTKLTNSKYFNYLNKFGLDDDRGYLTQLALYGAAFGWCRCALMFGDRETGRVMLLEPHADDLEECYNRAMEVCQILHKCKRFNDIYKYIDPPPPVPEVYRGQHTGNFILPYQMKGLHEFWYKVRHGTNKYGDSRLYVDSYAYPDEMKEYEPELC